MSLMKYFALISLSAIGIFCGACASPRPASGCLEMPYEVSQLYPAAHVARFKLQHGTVAIGCAKGRAFNVSD